MGRTEQKTIKENKMATMPISKLIIAMSLPAIIGMLIQALYNFVDSIFVSRISEGALTALSLSFPIQMLIIAGFVGLGVGITSVISRKLGENNSFAATVAAEHGYLLFGVFYLIIALILFVAVFIIAEVALRFLGFSGTDSKPKLNIVVEPGMAVGEEGKAALIPRNDPEMAVHYCLAAQYFGMKFVYLEAGSGAPKPVPVEMVRMVRENIGIPLIVGGGICTPEQVRELAKAGADIIITGTLVEVTDDVSGALEPIIKELRND